jgi:hypothetical protein
MGIIEYVASTGSSGGQLAQMVRALVMSNLSWSKADSNRKIKKQRH